MCPGLLAPPEPKKVAPASPPAPLEREEVAETAGESKDDKLKRKNKGTNSLIIPLGSAAGGNGLSVPK